MNIILAKILYKVFKLIKYGKKKKWKISKNSQFWRMFSRLIITVILHQYSPCSDHEYNYYIDSEINH